MSDERQFFCKTCKHEVNNNEYYRHDDNMHTLVAIDDDYYNTETLHIYGAPIDKCDIGEHKVDEGNGLILRTKGKSNDTIETCYEDFGKLADRLIDMMIHSTSSKADLYTDQGVRDKIMKLIYEDIGYLTYFRMRELPILMGDLN